MAAAKTARAGGRSRLYGATAMACILAFALAPLPQAAAQDLGALVPAPDTSGNKQMLLEADTLVFDRDNDTVTAAGNVQIEYDGNHLVAQRVIYNRKTKRVVAHGNVEMVDPKGTRTFADHVDVTDDFQEGFSNALRVETVDKTYFGAENGEREGGTVSTFNRGVYTACAPCEKKPSKPPIWRVKAQKIIWNGKSKTIRFLHSRFEFFGMPIAYFPVLETPDPTVKRKSGLLLPLFNYKNELGFGYTQPFYLALSPTYDLTLFPGYYSRQGFLPEAVWRQRFNDGQYTVTIAGIDQKDPLAFRAGTEDRGTPTDLNHQRGMIGTKGEFKINPRWTFGWDILAQTDKNFAYTYAINGYAEYIHDSQIYLTGLNDRNYFDLRAIRPVVQEQILNSSTSIGDKQPWVAPSFDYSYTPDEPVAGGELTVTLNSQALWRRNLDQLQALDPATFNPALQGPIVRGIDGSDARMTGEVEWKRSFVTDAGIVITPLLSARADAIYADYSQQTIDAIHGMANILHVDEDIRSAWYRYMATAGLEVRWPILFSTASAAHVLEPMAQIFVRPDAPYQNALGIPNEDAQSFVFDASTLFEEDKFSGYDRIEGGTRANVGLRYSGSFDNGWSANAIAGQSYQIAGQNPFDAPDLLNVGAYSGLQTARSDYVALVGLTSPGGISFATDARFDKDTFEVHRAEAKMALVTKPITLTARYAFIGAQPLYGVPSDRTEVTVGASTSFAQYWRAFGSSTYDITHGVITADSLGLAYLDDCFGFALTAGQSRNAFTKQVATNVGFNISFRTIGDFGSNSAKYQQPQ